MIIELTHQEKRFTADLSCPHDISIPYKTGPDRVRAWYLNPLQMEPVRMGDWVGAVSAGAAVNFFNIHFNPHGHGTHTETLGHIVAGDYPVSEHFRDFFCFAAVNSVTPEAISGDHIITLQQVQAMLLSEAVIIRTLPNAQQKCHTDYSRTNPPYIQAEAAAFLRDKGVKHLLIDLPSVDREEDQGLLLAHRAFWNWPDAPRTECTISELVFVSDEIEDGLWFMNLQVAAFYNDAAPSRPLLFRLNPHTS
jgi:kynurenine formamidase